MGSHSGIIAGMHVCVRAEPAGCLEDITDGVWRKALQVERETEEKSVQSPESGSTED